MTATQLVYCFNASGPSAQSVPGQTDIGSASYVDLMTITPADVGSPGDEIIWIVHARIGDADLGGIVGATKHARCTLRLVDSTGGNAKPSTIDVIAGRPLHPYRDGQHFGCVSYAAMHKSPATAAPGSSACLRVQAAFGWLAGQTVTRNLSILVEDLTVIAWNATRMTAAAINWAWSDELLSTRLTNVVQNVGATISLPAPVSGDRQWLVYGSAISDNGSAANSTLCDVRIAGATSSTVIGPLGTRSRAAFPNLDGINWHCVAGLAVFECSAGDPTATVQLRAWDDFVPGGGGFGGPLEKHSRVLGRALLAIDVTTLRPIWSQGRDPALNPPSPTMYGAPQGSPNYGEQTTPRITPTAALGQHRLVHGWAVPYNRHDPDLLLRFASEIYINGATNAPSSRQSPLYLLQDAFSDRHPDYQSTMIAAGRGALFLEHFGYYSPGDDVLDAGGNPTRVVRAYGDAGARAFYGLSQCLFSCQAWSGTLDEPEDQVAIGPTVYIQPDREALDPGDLPRLRYQPFESRSGGAVHRGVEFRTLDGRVLSWSLFLAPREVWSLSWRAATAQHQVLLAWLRNLTNGMFAWEHPIDGDLRAWVIAGDSLRVTNSAPGIWDISLDAAELTWTGS